MDTSNYYRALNRPSTSTTMGGVGNVSSVGVGVGVGVGINTGNGGGYYNQEGYMPNYYGGEPMDINQVNNMEQYQRMEQMASTYYEPLFRPPPTSCYAHSYSRHNVDPNPSFIAPPPPSPAPSQQSVHIGWYQQTPGGQYEQTLNMLQFSSSNGREARNKAEKNRRDKLNGSIQELSTMVPHVAESPRRVDKTAVLRFSAHGLRIHYVFGKTVNKTPAVRSQATDSLMKLLDSFLLTVTCRGQIVLISPSIEQHLGHCQTDLFGQNILHITHPDDHAMLKKHLIPTDLETLFDIQPEDENGEPRPRTQEEEDEIDRKLREDRRNFTVRLARAGPRSEPTTYEIVKIDGCFRRADSAPRGVKVSTFPSGLQLIRRARGRDDSVPLHSISGNDVVLVAMARVIKPPKICDRLIEANHYEYKTRHLIDGRIIQCDQRISLVAGYMTEEVNGLSPFTFMHQDDVRWVIVALRQMYDCNSAYGESCYRLITRTGKFIYLRSRGYLEIDKDTNTVHSFLCINTLVNEDEGRRRVQEMKNKFSIIINTKIPPSAIDAPAAENPHQLEKAVIYLIKNLQKCEDDDDDDEDDDDVDTDADAGPSAGANAGGGAGNDANIRDGRSSVKSRRRGSHHDGSSESDSNRHSKTPPLALIPPKTCTIKLSITKSVNVVNMSVTKCLKAQQQQQVKSPSSASEGDSRESVDMISNSGNRDGSGGGGVRGRDSSCGSSVGSFNANENQCRPSVVKKNGDNLMNVTKNLKNRVPPLPNSKGYFETNYSKQPQQEGRNSGSLVGYSYTSPGSVDQQITSNVLKRSRTLDDFEGETNVLTKRRNLGESEYFLDTSPLEEFTDSSANLTQVLSDSFEEIDRSLINIENATTELKDQCCNFDIGSTSQHQLSEIIEEHQEQREILENIQNEYHAHLQSTSINPSIISPIKDGTKNCGLQNSGDFKSR